MAWLYKRGETWWIGYRLNGKQTLVSTGTTDAAKAKQQLDDAEALYNRHKSGRAIDRLYQELTGHGNARLSLTLALDEWLKERANKTATSTHDRYRLTAERFKRHINATDNGLLLSAVSVADASKFLNDERAGTAASTANLTRKILAQFFKAMINLGHIRDNPVSRVARFKAQKGERVKRRAFTLNELATLYNKAPDDFWRYMILGEFSTGLRMVDLICLRVGAIDTVAGAIRLEDEKTEKPMFIPLTKPFRHLLVDILKDRKGAKAGDYLWPEQAVRHQSYKAGSGFFSNQFYDRILAPCGLVPPRANGHKAKKDGTGRSARRKTNEVSFHCLRHSFVSFLKSAGATQAVAKELAGHSSDQVNDLYTHVPEAELVRAINALPEFTSK